MDLLDRLFSRFHWYRRWCGGHWEKWHVLYLSKPIWYQVDECCSETGERPAACCEGLSACEDYPVLFSGLDL